VNALASRQCRLVKSAKGRTVEGVIGGDLRDVLAQMRDGLLQPFRHLLRVMARIAVAVCRVGRLAALSPGRCRCGRFEE
jgi:hypothetical protein